MELTHEEIETKNFPPLSFSETLVKLQYREYSIGANLSKIKQFANPTGCKPQSFSMNHKIIFISWRKVFRFRANNKMLKIRSVEAEDAGVYFCKGINGFGSAEVRIDLMVIGRAK